MTEEEMLQPIQTKKDMMDVLVEFNEYIAVPRMKEVFDEKFKEAFDKSFDEKFNEIVLPEIRKSEQRTSDYADKRVGEAKGEIILAINKTKESDKEFKNKVIDIFDKNNLVNKSEKEGLAVLAA